MLRKLIVWLEYCRENGAHSQKVVCYETAARRSAPGPFDAWLAITKTLPNVRARGCSSEEDAKAEGCAASISKTIRGWTPQVFEFSLLWDSIHGKQPGRRFDNAPWVWVYEFQRIK